MESVFGGLRANLGRMDEKRSQGPQPPHMVRNLRHDRCLGGRRLPDLALDLTQEVAVAGWVAHLVRILRT
jgi:hypothetical protein